MPQCNLLIKTCNFIFAKYDNYKEICSIQINKQSTMNILKV